MRVKLTIIMIFACRCLWSQADLNDYIESIATDGERNLADLIEEYNYLKRNPININNATKEELSEIIFFNEVQVLEIINHRIQNNGFVAIEELILLPSISVQELEFFKTFCTVTANKQVNQNRYQLEQILRLGYTVKKADKKSSTIYTPSFLFRNKQWINNQLTIGITMQKDMDERWIGDQTLTDFNSISIQYKPQNTIIKQLNFGDYILNIGEGLTFWNGFSLGKSLQFGERKNGKTLASYHGADEFNFMRGASAVVHHKNFTIVPFVSFKRLDATIKDGQVNSIRTNGIHQTESDIEAQNKLREVILGSSMQYKKDKFSLGVYSSYWNYSHSFYYQDPSQVNLSTNKNQLNSGIHGTIKLRQSEWFGELACNENFNTAWTTGFRTQINPNIKWTTSIRNYNKGFKSHYANSFGERSNSSNELGFYNGIKWQINPHHYINIYYDIYQFPGFSYQLQEKTNGRDMFLEIGKTFNTSKIYFRIKNELRTSNEKQSISRARINFQHKVNDYTLTSRLEATNYQTETGYLIFQDIKKRFKGFSTTLRLAYFNSPSYNSATYAYQPNVLYAFQTRAYYKEGGQVLLLIGKRLSKNIKVWAQLDHLAYFKDKNLGKLEVQQNNRNTINFQLQLLL